MSCRNFIQEGFFGERIVGKARLSKVRLHNLKFSESLEWLVILLVGRKRCREKTRFLILLAIALPLIVPLYTRCYIFWCFLLHIQEN